MLLLTPEQSLFCKDCYYLLAVVASKNTKATLYLADDQTTMPISPEKTLSDMLLREGDYTRGSFYDLYNGTIEVNVHEGKLSVMFTFNDRTITKTFSKSS